MLWLLLHVAVAGSVVWWVNRALQEIRGYQRDWQDLADTQAKHETTIRYLHQLVNPIARSGHAPMPRHLQALRQENVS